MNSAQHLMIGFIGTFVVAIILVGTDGVINSNEGMIAVIFGAAIGSILPDIIEPARHWTHRKYYHSKRVLKTVGGFSGIMFLFVGLQALFGLGLNITFIVFALPFSYTLHLLADWTTPARLPD